MSHGESVLAGQSKGVMLVGQNVAVSNQVLMAAVSNPRYLIPAMSFHDSFILLSR